MRISGAQTFKSAGNSQWSEWHRLKRGNLFVLTEQILHSTKTLKHTLIILTCMANNIVFMKLVSLCKKSNPHWFWDMAKHHVLWELIPHTLDGIISLVERNVSVVLAQFYISSSYVKSQISNFGLKLFRCHDSWTHVGL